MGETAWTDEVGENVRFVTLWTTISLAAINLIWLWGTIANGWDQSIWLWALWAVVWVVVVANGILYMILTFAEIMDV